MQDRGRWPGDLHVSGTISADAWSLANNAVRNEHVDVATTIDALKLQHQYLHKYSQKHGTAVATERMPLFIAQGSGEIVTADIGLTVANIGAATITVDLLKNGATILSATWQLTSAQAPYDLLAASLGAGATYLAGDFFEISVTAAAGGGTVGQGLAASIVAREKAA